MPKYLTVLHYQAADDGVSLSNLSNASLARTIARAESDIDAFVGFDLKQGGFEPHQVWLQSKFDERTLKTRTPNYPVPIRQVTRYRIQVSNISTAGAGFFANISPADATLNVNDGYVEIIPLQSITYSLSPVLVQLGLRPPIVQMDCEVGYFLAAFGDTLYPVDDQYLTFAALRGFWAQTYTQSLASQPNQLPPIPPVVYVNGVAQATSVYSINYNEGSVTFATQQLNASVTADYTYTIPDNIRDATIARTTYLLGQRALNQAGLQGLDFARTGDQQIKRHANADQTQGVNGVLDVLTASRLSGYVPIPIG